MQYEDPIIDESIHGNVNAPAESPLWLASKLLVSLLALIAILYLLLSLLVFQIVRNISFETEQKWFKPMTKQVLVAFTDNSPKGQIKAAELQRIADKLIQATLDKDPEHPLAKMTITLHYSDDETVNAFAMPGGDIVVMKGLVDALPNENVLAMVIGHEIAHIIHRDSLNALGRTMLTNVMILSILGSDGSELVGTGMNMLTLSYSRQAESDADKTGLTLLYNAYGNAYGASQLFSVFAKANPEQNAWLSMTTTHPAPLQRRDEIQTQISENGYSINKNASEPFTEALKHD